MSSISICPEFCFKFSAERNVSGGDRSLIFKTKQPTTFVKENNNLLKGFHEVDVVIAVFLDLLKKHELRLALCAENGQQGCVLLQDKKVCEHLSHNTPRLLVLFLEYTRKNSLHTKWRNFSLV